MDDFMSDKQVAQREQNADHPWLRARSLVLKDGQVVVRIEDAIEAAAGPRDEITLDELVLRKWADLARRLIAVAPTSAVMDETGISAPHSTPPERQSIRAEADRIILRWLERDLALAKASDD